MSDVGNLFVKNGTIKYDKVAWRIDKATFSLCKMRNFVRRGSEQIIDIEGNFAYIHDIIINHYSKNSFFSKNIPINLYISIFFCLTIVIYFVK